MYNWFQDYLESWNVLVRVGGAKVLPDSAR